MTREQRTFCRICIAGCGMVITVEGNEVVGVAGDPDHPFSHGYLCPKGRALGEAHHREDRLDGAFVRRHGELVPTSVDECLDDLGAVLRRVIDESGGGAVGVFMGGGAFNDPAGAWAMRKLRSALGTEQAYSTASVDSVAKALVTTLMAGTEALVPHPDDQGRLVVFVGSNPVVSHGQSTAFPDPVQWLRAVRARGEVIVIDPRRTETAQHADRYLAARPGTDYAVLAHVIRALLDDLDLVALSERAAQIDGLRDAVAPFDAATAAGITGVAPDELGALVESVRRAGRLAVITGTGVTMSAAGNLTEWLAWALMIITDSLDQPGGMWFNPGYLAKLDRRPTLPASGEPKPGPGSRPDIRKFNGEYPSSLIPEEIEAGRLRALIVCGGNIVGGLPATERLEAALGQLDALVVLDVRHTGSTAVATHVLATTSQLERTDLNFLDLFNASVSIQFTEAVVEAPSTRPPMWRTVAKIAASVGHDIVGADPDELTNDAVLSRATRGLDLDEMRRSPSPHVETMARYGWVQERLPTGRWQLAPAQLVAQLQSMRHPDGLVLTPRRQPRHMNAQPFRGGDRPEALMHPDDAADSGVSDGDLVEITSDSGSLRMAVKVTDANVRGSVSIPHGWEDLNVNRLISHLDLDDLTGMPHFGGTEVTVAPT